MFSPSINGKLEFESLFTISQQSWWKTLWTTLIKLASFNKWQFDWQGQSTAPADVALDVFVIAVRGDLSQCPAILKQYYFDPEMALQLHTMSSGKDDVTGTSMTVAVRALMTLLPVKLSLWSFLCFVVIESSKRKKTFEGESINQNILHCSSYPRCCVSEIWDYFWFGFSSLLFGLTVFERSIIACWSCVIHHSEHWVSPNFFCQSHIISMR